jgi:hypothetical protein
MCDSMARSLPIHRMVPSVICPATRSMRGGQGGDEAAVTARIEALFAAGATDVWAAPFPVGEDRSASRARTRALLKELANA